MERAELLTAGSWYRQFRALWALVGVLAAACGPRFGTGASDAGTTNSTPTGSGFGGEAGATSHPLEDFHLEDVNATSSTYQFLVSPRDYLEQVSAWYFGDST